MRRLLFLDDNPVRHIHFKAMARGAEVHPARTVGEAVRLLNAAPFDVAFLDHDLGPGGCGCEVARHVAALPPDRRPEVVIHSHNPHGVREMASILASAGVPHKIVPFGT